MWLTINIIVAFLCVCGFGYAKHIDSSENYEALFIGLAFAAIGVVDMISFILWFIFD